MSFLIGVLIPLQRYHTPHLHTSQASQLQTPSHRGLGFHMWTLGGHKHSVYSTPVLCESHPVRALCWDSGGPMVNSQIYSFPQSIWDSLSGYLLSRHNCYCSPITLPKALIVTFWPQATFLLWWRYSQCMLVQSWAEEREVSVYNVLSRPGKQLRRIQDVKESIFFSMANFCMSEVLTVPPVSSYLWGKVKEDWSAIMVSRLWGAMNNWINHAIKWRKYILKS